MVLTTYLPATTELTNFNYAPLDQTTYTATSIAGQRATIFHPDGVPADYPRMYGDKADKRTRWKTLLVENLSGDSPNGTTSGAPSSSLAAANGLSWQWLRNGGAVVSAQKTSQQSGNAMAGKGFVHLPGGVDGYYESRNRPNCLKDSVFIIQHLRWNARVYAYDDPRSYRLSPWIAQFGVNSGFGQPWIGSAPSRAGELGSGGPYEENTVPNFIIAQSIYPYFWYFFDFNEANTGCFFVKAETGGAGADDVIATSIGAAPRRYVMGMGAQALLSDVGQPCHPKTFFVSNTGPEDLNYGEPFIEGRRKFNTGVHDSKHMLALRAALPPGTVDMRLPPGAAYTLGVSQNTSTAIPRGFYDGQMTGALSAHTASTGRVTFTGSTSDGDTVTISDGVTQVTYEFDNNASVTAGNVSVAAGTSTQSVTNLLAAIVTSGLLLSAVNNGTTADFTSTQTDIAANATWSCTGTKTTVRGLASWGSVTINTNPSDAETLTLSDGLNSAIFEYDNNASTTAGRIRVTIGGSATLTMTALKNAIVASGLGLTFNASADATASVDLTINSRGILNATTPTWTQTGGHHSIVQPNGGGAPTAQSFTNESENDGAGITALVNAARNNEQRWDKSLPPCGIRRSGQVAGARVAATGNITFTGGTNAADGETLVLGDGLTSVTFEFDAGAAGTGAITAGRTGVQIAATTAGTMTNLLTAIANSGLRLAWIAGIPSTSSTDFTSLVQDGDPNVTWTETASNTTVTGLTGGTQGRPRCIVPTSKGPDGIDNGRDGVRLRCTSLSGDSDLFWGTSPYNCRNRLRAGDETWIPTTGKVWACSAGGGSQVAKYEARECDERSK
jgi:hypothetical protein